MKCRQAMGLSRVVWVFRAVVLLAVFNAGPLALAEDTPLLGPINSDPLTQRGISPRVLDVAVTPMSQGLRYEALVRYKQTTDDGASGSEQFRLIFDPDTSYGRDLHIELESDPLLSAKDYRRMLEVSMGTDYWVRKEDHIYQASSLQLLSSSSGEDVIAFRYSPRRIPTSMSWLAQLSGRVYVVDGILERIELTGDKSFERNGIRHDNYRVTVYFGSVTNYGGHIISGIDEKFRARINRKWRDMEVQILMQEYSSEKLGVIEWQSPALATLLASTEEDIENTELKSFEIADDKLVDSVVAALGVNDESLARGDTVRLDLHRALPFYADEVRKLGFELPKTYGLGFAAHYQETKIDMQGFKVGGIDITNNLPLVDPLGSDIDSDILTAQFRADIWILPFLNLSLLAGELETSSDVTLRFTPGFQNLVELKTGEKIPEFVTFDTSTSGTSVGLGLMTGFQYEQLVFSLGVNYIESITDETNSEIKALLYMGMVGYDFGDVGLQALAGVQYLDTDRTIEGSIDLENGDPLVFEIDIGLEETTFILGFNKDIGRNWTLSSFVGANGTKSSLTMNFGYRW